MGAVQEKGDGGEVSVASEVPTAPRAVGDAGSRAVATQNSELARAETDEFEEHTGVDSVAGVTYGEAMTDASIREASRLCSQAVRQFKKGDRIDAVSSLELAKNMLVPAIGWLMHSSGILVEDPADDVDPSPPTEAGDFPGFYL